MASLARWEPIRDMLNMRRDMDRLFDEFFAPLTEQSWDTPMTWGLAVDVSENDDTYVVKASLPGVQPEDIEVTLADNVLTIKGDARADVETEGEHYHVRERRSGSFSRTLTLPTPLKPDAIEAVHENGVLTLTLPKAEETKPKRISIKPTAERKVIEG